MYCWSCVKLLHSCVYQRFWRAPGYPRLFAGTSVNTLSESVGVCVWTGWNRGLTFKRLQYVYCVPHLKTQLRLSSCIIVIDSWNVKQRGHGRQRAVKSKNSSTACLSCEKEEKSDGWKQHGGCCTSFLCEDREFCREQALDVLKSSVSVTHWHL